MTRSKSWSSSSFDHRDRKFDLFNDSDQKLETSSVFDNMHSVFRKKMIVEKRIDRQYEQTLKESQLQQQDKLIHFKVSDDFPSSNAAPPSECHQVKNDDAKSGSPRSASCKCSDMFNRYHLCEWTGLCADL